MKSGCKKKAKPTKDGSERMEHLLVKVDATFLLKPKEEEVGG